jgi:hypothetical protein
MGVRRSNEDHSDSRELEEGAGGYEPSHGRNFNNLQDAGGAQSHCKERQETHIGQLMDSGEPCFSPLSQKMVNARRTVPSRQPQQQNSGVAAETA